MKQIVRRICTVAALLGLLCSSARAVITAISRQGCDIVLTWPSTPGQVFTVQFRDSLSPPSSWMTLTNGLPATAGATTMYVHPSVLPDCGRQMQAHAAATSTTMTDEERAARREDLRKQAEAMAKWLMAQLEEAVARARALREEWAKHPESRLTVEARLDREVQMTEGGSGCCGFYRVLHTPTWSVNITGSTFDGPTFIPVDFADYVDRVNDVVVLLNGQPAPQAVLTPFVQQGVTNWGVGIYFDLVPNGNYQIQLLTTVRLTEETGEGFGSTVLSNQPTSIIVDNQVAFTNLDDLIYGSTYTFRAQTKNANTDWTIDIYDAWGQFINGASGHTSNGQIQWTWDFRDTSGNLRDDLDNDPFWDPYITFDTASASAAPAAPATRPMPTPVPWPTKGGWIVAHQDRFYLDAGSNYSAGDQYYQEGIIDIAGGSALWDLPLAVRALKFGTNVYTQTERNVSWANLRATMFDPRFRNLYYYGHGSANDIGADVHTFDSSNYVTGGRIFAGSEAHLSSGTVRTELTFNRFAGSRPYRFTFLDRCNTANGDWPDAFGIGKATNTLQWYTGTNNTRHVRPSAFVGWTVTIGGTKDWGTVDTFWEFREFWMANWSVDSLNYTLTQALRTARETSNWIPESKMNQSMRVYGYGDLRFNEYNTKNSWP